MGIEELKTTNSEKIEDIKVLDTQIQEAKQLIEDKKTKGEKDAGATLEEEKYQKHLDLIKGLKEQQLAELQAKLK